MNQFPSPHDEGHIGRVVAGSLIARTDGLSRNAAAGTPRLAAASTRPSAASVSHTRKTIALNASIPLP